MPAEDSKPEIYSSLFGKRLARIIGVLITPVRDFLMQSEELKENEEGITFPLDSVSLSPVRGPHKIISNLVGGQNFGRYCIIQGLDIP